MNGFVSSLQSFLKRPIVLIVIAGLLIRLVLMPLLTYDFDIYHWGLIIANFESGNNLYELDGYYYTPVWGYLLAFISTVENFLIDIGAMGMRFTDLLPIEELIHPYHTATITSLAFNVCMKIPLIICDVAVGYLIYRLIQSRTGSTKKATYGFALWFFCPIIIYMSSVQAMFDTFSALLLLLTVILLYKDKCFLGGMVFSVAVLLKFFPAFCIFVLVAYIIVKHREDGLAKRRVIEAVAGAAIMAAVLFLPQIIEGQMGDAFSFIFGRVGMSSIWSSLFTTANILIAVLSAFFFGYAMYRTPKEKADSSMFLYVLLTITAATLISTTPQYVIVMLPMLIVYIATTDRTYLKCWALIGISAFLGAFILNNFSLFSALAGYTSIVSPEWVVSYMQIMETQIFGFTVVSVLTAIANMIQYIGILLILLFHFAESIEKRMPKIGGLIMRIKGKEELNIEA